VENPTGETAENTTAGPLDGGVPLLTVL
jgi:hypothetical protein